MVLSVTFQKYSIPTYLPRSTSHPTNADLKRYPKSIHSKSIRMRSIFKSCCWCLYEVTVVSLAKTFLEWFY